VGRLRRPTDESRPCDPMRSRGLRSKRSSQSFANRSCSTSKLTVKIRIQDFRSGTSYLLLAAFARGNSLSDGTRRGSTGILVKKRASTVNHRCYPPATYMLCTDAQGLNRNVAISIIDPLIRVGNRHQCSESKREQGLWLHLLAL
jgi:hypothetical protein